MKKLLTVLCFLGAFLLSGADLLEETAAILDILERDYCKEMLKKMEEDTHEQHQ